MKWFSKHDCHQFIVGILFLIQITATVCSVRTDNRIIEIGSLSSLPENYFHKENDIGTSIFITYNSLTTLPENIFTNQTKLLKLYLYENKLSTLSENIFQHQTNLNELDLANNEITELPANIFKNQIKLELLQLAENNLTTLPANIFQFQVNLKELWLWSNRLTELPENIFSAQINLQNLGLSGNKFTTLPETIFNSQTNLKELNLSGNKLKLLAENIFENQTNLESLNLNGNEITAIPENIFKNQINLTKLNLSFNNLTTLPEKVFENQTKLEILYLQRNQLMTLSERTLSDISKNVNMYPPLLFSNSWVCDCDFLEMIRLHMNAAVYLGWIVCADGERVDEKLRRPMISLITKKSNHTAEYKQKYVNSTICPVLPSNEIVKICPSECNCLLPNDNSSIFIDCSNNKLKSVPSELTNAIYQMPALKAIEYNISFNEIVHLANATMPGFSLITKITASNNLIESVSVDNFPENLTEIDLSGNKLTSFTPSVIEHLNNLKTLTKLALGENSWTCDRTFCDFIRLNLDKVDYKAVACNYEGSLIQKHNDHIKYWIKNDSRDGMNSTLIDSSEKVYKIKHDEEIGQVCPSECNCLISHQNTTISYECSNVNFETIWTKFEMGKVQWPLLKHRRMIFAF